MWNPREHLKNAGAAIEVSHPDKILDLASSEEVTSFGLSDIGESTFMAAVSTSKSVSIFYTKSVGKASVTKTKVIKRDS